MIKKVKEVTVTVQLLEKEKEEEKPKFISGRFLINISQLNDYDGNLYLVPDNRKEWKGSTTYIGDKIIYNAFLCEAEYDSLEVKDLKMYLEIDSKIKKILKGSVSKIVTVFKNKNVLNSKQEYSVNFMNIPFEMKSASNSKCYVFGVSQWDGSINKYISDIEYIYQSFENPSRNQKSNSPKKDTNFQIQIDLFTQ